MRTGSTKANPPNRFPKNGRRANGGAIGRPKPCPPGKRPPAKPPPMKPWPPTPPWTPTPPNRIPMRCADTGALVARITRERPRITASRFIDTLLFHRVDQCRRWVQRVSGRGRTPRRTEVLCGSPLHGRCGGHGPLRRAHPMTTRMESITGPRADVGFPVLDADGHVAEPHDLWGRYCDPSHRQAATDALRSSIFPTADRD